MIMEGSKIMNAGKIVESLIGKGVRIHENDSKPSGYRFIVGDNSDIFL